MWQCKQLLCLLSDNRIDSYVTVYPATIRHSASIYGLAIVMSMRPAGSSPPIANFEPPISTCGKKEKYFHLPPPLYWKANKSKIILLVIQ